jgi:peptidyl-prolyl cis-trans isomerase D
MLDKLREGSQGLIVKVILGLVILSFALAGVGSYITAPKESIAATVNGQNITLSELEQAYQNQRNSLESQYGESFSLLASNPSYMAELRKQVLDEMISDVLLDQAADELGLLVSDAQIRQTVAGMREFQVGGVFDFEHYKSVLARARLSTDQFSAMMRRDLTRDQLRSALLGSEFSLPSESRILATLGSQTRDARYVKVPVASFSSGLQVSDEELSSYYDQHRQDFMTQEGVDLEYILVDADTLAGNVTVTSEQARAYFEAHQEIYRQPEQRRVAHILVAFGDDKKAARKKIEAISTKLANGQAFAALAKAESDDTFSGENGGELDWFESGVMDPAFDTAAFALSDKGLVSDIVESAFGYHLIKLLEIKPSQMPAFSAVEADIIAQLKSDGAMEQYFELAQKLSDLSFEQPDSLAQVADELGVTLQIANQVTRSKLPDAINDPQVTQTAFSESAISEKFNSEIINLSDSKALVLRVRDYHAAEIKALDVVHDEITALVTQEKAQAAAKGYADRLHDVFSDNAALKTLLAEKSLKVDAIKGVNRSNRDLAQSLVRAIFSMPKPQGQQFSSQVVSARSGDFYVAQVTGVNQPELEPSAVAAMGQQVTSLYAYGDFQELIAYLKTQADIEIKI